MAGTEVSHKVLTIEIRGVCVCDSQGQAARTGCLRFIELAGTGKCPQPYQTHQFLSALNQYTLPHLITNRRGATTTVLID